MKCNKCENKPWRECCYICLVSEYNFYACEKK